MLLRQRHRPVAQLPHGPRRGGAPGDAVQRLRLLSFNIQGGIHTQGYHHYVTRSWQHLWPHPTKHQSLAHIARLLRDFDIVALQEVDGGSFRSGYVNQVKYLAEAAGFPYWYQQLNRDLGPLAQHSNGVLSRYHPHLIEDHRLPGLIPGRGVILVQFGEGPEALMVLVLHLSLGSRAQFRQLDYIRRLIGDHRHVVVMGDLNSPPHRVLEHSALRDIGLHRPGGGPTFPSWQPAQALDHILVSSTLAVRRTQVLDFALSDHLPIAVELDLPTPQVWH